ncbi:saccharopine dehydrogenase-like protein [Chloropicon primus]|uniref:Saccharopine dehydrogenase-like protein n=1 Tax=Chloropicon primus TaxID=1764295 RepID=A0A5B8MIV6_9CHLO|nr:saccharopine dehydrogenase-like protein [Chloropicon primus]UPQ99411.1 saccharopine dehydrogenase-like protein [Chloropicon primus]|eukprot:QDZ20201.1 saccharopine dehydrogenase-like protein [Chloropicon primus]
MGVLQGGGWMSKRGGGGQCRCRCRCRSRGSVTARAETSGRGSGGEKTRKVVVLGGAGRVGSATAAAILRERENDANLAGTRVVLAGRRPREEAFASLPPELTGRVSYERCDIGDPASLDRLLAAQGGEDCALVIHAAGPFQQTESCPVLEAAIRNKTGGYIDVCDDAEHTRRAKADLGARARDRGVPAVVSCGVYPGLSNVMASFMCEEGTPFPESKPKKVRFSYFTAGSGGVGATILATSILLLGERATQFVEGERRDVETYSERNVVEFGQKLGKREVFNLNLPEVFTAHEVLGVPNVSAYFGTSPGVWNFMMGLMASFLPESLLTSRAFANGLAQLLMPLVVAVDNLVGKTTAMRIDVKYDNDKTSSSLFVHPDTAYTAGTSTAAFAAAVLSGTVPPGVHYPEERCVVQDYESFFKLSSSKAQAFLVAQAPWRLEQVGVRIGMGMYL